MRVIEFYIAFEIIKQIPNFIELAELRDNPASNFY